MLGVCFRVKGRQVESRCGNTHVRMVGQVFKRVQVCQFERILWIRLNGRYMAHTDIRSCTN